MKTIKRAELVELLSKESRCQFVGITAVTRPSLMKGHPFTDLTCKSEGTVQINWNYQSTVNRRREKEGQERDFESLPRQWGTHLPGTPLVFHTPKGESYTKWYVVALPVALKATYFDGDKEVCEEEVKKWKRISKSSRQGLDNEVKPRDYEIDNLLRVTYNGEVYMLTETSVDAKIA